MNPVSRSIRVALCALFLGPAAGAQQDRPGDFDYYVLSLSWSPTWCDLTGEARDAPQCAPGRELGWSLHGLWPQFESGWPEWCDSPSPGPGAAARRAMVDIMGSAGLADYQWRKHGSCSGLSSDDYLRLSRLAYQSVERPDVFRRLDGDVTLPARVVEEAWLADNPDLLADGITVTCRDGHVQEVRICLTRDLEIRPCAADVRRDCTLDRARLPAIDR